MTLPPPEPGAVVVVTGASSGIGTALACQLASHGYNLLLTARREHRLEELAGEISAKFGVEATTTPASLGDFWDLRELADQLADEKVIGLCNNAGTANFGRFQELPRDEHRELITVNAIAVHELTVAMLPGMLERGAGAILNVGSVGGFQPMPRNSTYSASKAFVNWFSEALHEDLRGTGVSSSLLCPGLVQTELHARAGVPHVSGSGPRFAWTSTERVARAGVRAMLRGKRRVTPGVYAKASVISAQIFPQALVLRTLRNAADQVARARRRERRGRTREPAAPVAAPDTVVPPEL